jgi:6-pyruvoyltetrahydropterin/6-carboxytetrahydropterin synthase
MYTISKEFHFSASHQLTGLPQDHPCSRLHGHNYVIVVEMQSLTLNEVGMVRDYRDLEPVKKYIDQNYDHKHLNDVLDFNPTAENMSEHMFKLFNSMFPEITAVTVKETEKTAAKFTVPNFIYAHV